MTNAFQQQFLYCFTWSSNIFFRFFYLSIRFLPALTIIESSPIHWLTGLTNLFPSFWLFLVLFWKLWMLVTADKPCHVPHASRITTWGTIFTEKLFSVFKEWVKSWSHAFMISYLKTFTKNFWQSVQRKWLAGKKEKKLVRQLQSFLR